jgi:hypothetical protein
VNFVAFTNRFWQAFNMKSSKIIFNTAGILYLFASLSFAMVPDASEDDGGGDGTQRSPGAASASAATGDLPDGDAAGPNKERRKSKRKRGASPAASHPKTLTAGTASASAANADEGEGGGGGGGGNEDQSQKLAKRARAVASPPLGEAAPGALASASASAAAAAPASLEELRQQTRAEARRQIVAATPLLNHNLHSLIFSYTPYGGNYRELVSRFRAGMVSFDISNQFLGDDFTEQWATDPALLQESNLLRTVQNIFLNDNFFTDESLEKLNAIMRVLFSLRWLDVSHNKFTRFPIFSIAPEIEHLDLSGNCLSDAGMRELFKQGAKASLTTLCLHDNRDYGDMGIMWLFWQSAAWRVNSLSIEGKNLTQEGIAAVGERLPESVRFLVVTGVGSDVVEGLQRALEGRELRKAPKNRGPVARVANVFSAETMGLPSLLPPPRTPRIQSIMQSVSHGGAMESGVAAAAAAADTNGHRNPKRSMTVLLPPPNTF